MKHIKEIELFERIIQRNPTLGDYIFDKFIENNFKISKSSIYINDIFKPTKNILVGNYRKIISNYKEPNINKKILDIDISFRRIGEYYLTDEDFNSIPKVINNLKQFCNVKFRIENNIFLFNLQLSTKEIETIKKLPDYNDWLLNSTNQHQKYREDIKLKKSTKKYNL